MAAVVGVDYVPAGGTRVGAEEASLPEARETGQAAGAIAGGASRGTGLAGGESDLEEAGGAAEDAGVDLEQPGGVA